MRTRGRSLRRTMPCWLLLCAAAWLVFSFALASAAPLADEAVTRAEYRLRVEAAAQMLAAPQDAVGGGAAVAQAAADLRNITMVELPSGRKVRVEPLLSGRERPDIALARLQAAARQLAAAENDRVTEHLAVLDGVLAELEAQRQESFWERLRRWLAGERDRIDAPAAEASSQVATGLDWAVGIIGGLIAVVVISFLIQGLLRGFVVDAEARRRRAEGEEEAVSAVSARQQAVELARAGNFRAAVRRLYLATLLSLEEHGLLRHDRSLTNREMLARLGEGSPVRSGLAPVVDTFEQVWYGVQEPDQHTFDTYQAAVDAAGGAILAAAHRPRADGTEVANGAA